MLAGITHTPLLSRHLPGYDPDAGIFHAYSAGDFPPIPDNPSKDDAQKALVILSRPLSEYHFANAASRSVALAAMLTATVRVEIANAPMFVFDASVPASGKSKLMSSVGVMALGKIPAFTTFAKSDEENRKRLEASLIARQQVIAIDNVSDIMDNDTLAAILTGQSMSPRILGRSETLTVDTRVMLMATGNNISVHGDMARRVLKCRIEPPHTNPEEVRYSFDPVQRAIANHRELVVAALTILRAYRQSGQKVETMRFGSFEGWEFIAKALVWLREADPNLTRLEVKQFELADNKVAGLRIRAGERSATWLLCTRLRNGKRTRIKLGAWPAMGLSDAREAARAKHNEVVEGTDPNEEKREVQREAARAARTQRKLSDVLDDYQRVKLSQLRRGAPARRGIDGQRGLLRKFASKDIASIARTDIVDAVRKHAEKAPMAANRNLAYVKAFFNWCIDQEIVESNPAATIKKPAKERTRDRFHSLGELMEIWDAMRELGYPFGPLYRLLIVVPMRREEVAAIPITELDLEPGGNADDAV